MVVCKVFKLFSFYVAEVSFISETFYRRSAIAIASRPFVAIVFVSLSLAESCDWDIIADIRLLSRSWLLVCSS